MCHVSKPEKSDVLPKADSEKRLTRSSTGGFDFRLNCFLCAQFVNDRENRMGRYTWFSVKVKKLIEQLQMPF